MIVEGQRVIYAGDTDPFQQVGATGKVIALSGQAAHVQWLDGPKVGQIDLTQQYELLPERTAAEQAPMSTFDSALDSPVTATLSVRATYDESGEEGVVNVLAEAGHLAMLSEYVDEAVGTLSARIRQDPMLGDVLAQLEPDEADCLISRVASALFTDRMGEG